MAKRKPKKMLKLVEHGDIVKRCFADPAFFEKILDNLDQELYKAGWELTQEDNKVLKMRLGHAYEEKINLWRFIFQWCDLKDPKKWTKIVHPVMLLTSGTTAPGPFGDPKPPPLWP